MRWKLTVAVIVGASLATACSDTTADEGTVSGPAESSSPVLPSSSTAIATGTVRGPDTCRDLLPPDGALLDVAPEITFESQDPATCRFSVDPKRIDGATQRPAFFYIVISTGPRVAVESYRDFEEAAERDPAAAASHRGHEVTETEELDAPGWSYGHLTKSRSVENPGLYADDEATQAAFHLVTETASLHCVGDLSYSGVTLDDVRVGVPDLLNYCDSVKSVLWTP